MINEVQKRAIVDIIHNELDKYCSIYIRLAGDKILIRVTNYSVEEELICIIREDGSSSQTWLVPNK